MLETDAHSIESLIQFAKETLASVSDSAKLDGQLLLAHALEKEINYLYTWPEQMVSAEQKVRFLSLLDKRAKGEPIAYLVGYREFWSLELAVSPATLIPRPDTEVLVETVLNNHSNNVIRCLDLGTGTGAIALALASERSKWSIDAIDFNEDAVSLAQSNVKCLSLEQVNVFQSHWFERVQPEPPYQLIVSNPPYIDPCDVHLNQGDVRFEPRSALVSENKGLADIEFIIDNARDYLEAGGYLYFEHGYDQASKVQRLFAQYQYTNIITVQDYNANDRITYACYN